LVAELQCCNPNDELLRHNLDENLMGKQNL
jgi:hypothetical protein